MTDNASLHFIETAHFEFQRMKALAEKTMARLNDTEFEWTPDPDTNSVRIIVQHLAGNLLSRWTGFLNSDGEKPWRNRDAEFEAQQLPRAELMQQWEQGWGALFSAINGLGENDVIREVTIRGEKLTVTQAILRQVSHYSYHTGQIIFIAKQIKKHNWESLTIPKGQSTAFSTKGTYLGKNPA